MKFHDDMNRLNNTLIEKGFLKVVPCSIRLDRYFTEEEKANNKAFADSHNDNEWTKRCDETRERIANENIKLMEYLKQYFTFGQYDKEYTDDYDFWFWCNSLYNTTNGRLTGRDYSYITLTLKDKNNFEENERVFVKAKELIKNYPAKNIQAIFQYSQIEMKENIEKEAKRIFDECNGKFVQYGSFTGKLGMKDGKYFFRKKNAKKYFYWVEPVDICVNVNV